jgi:holin-like protein
MSAVTISNSLSRYRSLQIALLLLLWLLGQELVRRTRLPLPGALIGMSVLLALLWSGRLKLEAVKAGADWFLGEMLLFFVPAVLAVRDHGELLGWTGIKLMVVILLGTTAVMASTALTVEIAARRWCGQRQACADVS